MKYFAIYRVTRTGRHELLHSRVQGANEAEAIRAFHENTGYAYRTKHLEAREAV